jgi:putative SOS response-associated peptidase YedK
MRSVWGGDRPPGLEEDAMCGRYALYGPVSRLREAFDAVPEDFEFEPRWNAAPMQWLPVVR